MTRAKRTGGKTGGKRRTAADKAAEGKAKQAEKERQKYRIIFDFSDAETRALFGKWLFHDGSDSYYEFLENFALTTPPDETPRAVGLFRANALVGLVAPNVRDIHVTVMRDEHIEGLFHDVSVDAKAVLDEQNVHLFGSANPATEQRAEGYRDAPYDDDAANTYYGPR